MRMRTFDVQGIEIDVSRSAAFRFVSEPQNLPRWAQAFKRADHSSAQLETANGPVEVQLRTLADSDAGTIDWQLRFADGTVGLAHSRVVETARETCIYSFVLHAPPVPLEQLEGALDAQRLTLRTELATLKRLLEVQ
jgi:hypothetical protein